MGLGDAISRIIIDVKAETKNARTQLHELNGAIEAMGKFTQFAREAMDEYDEHLRLATATANVNIASLSKAFRGLVSEHDMLTFAAQTQTGVFALNQKEMEKIAQAALALRNRGFGAEEALKKLTDAAVKGKVGGLDDLGLSIKEGASRAESLRNMMTELDKVIKDSGEGYNQAAEDVKRLGIEWDNAAAAAKRYTVEALKAIDFDKIHELEKLMAKGLSPEDAMGELVSRDSARSDLAAQQAKDRAAAQLARRKSEMEVIEFDEGYVYDREGRQKYFKEQAEKAREKASLRAKEWTDLLVQQLEEEVAMRQKAQQGPRSMADLGLGENALGGFREEMKKLQSKLMEGGTRESRYAEFEQQRKKPYLEAVFGPIEQFDAYKEAFSTMGEVWGGFSDAVGASYEAIVTGQGSVSAAFKKMFADSIMATGKASAVDALRETALGIASLALGPIGGASASAHFTAAGVHAAVALAAGVAAHSLGTSASAQANAAGASSGRGKESAGSTPGSGGHNGGQERVREIHTFTYLDPFANWNEPQRKAYAQQMVNKAVEQSSARR